LFSIKKEIHSFNSRATIEITQTSSAFGYNGFHTILQNRNSQTVQ